MSTRVNENIYKSSLPNSNFSGNEKEQNLTKNHNN